MAPLLKNGEVTTVTAEPEASAVVPLSKQLGIISLVEDCVRILGARLTDEIELIVSVVLATIK